MSTFVVNGQTVTAEKNKKLLRFLRDDLGLTSVKDGCSEGACGACTDFYILNIPSLNLIVDRMGFAG